MISSGQIAYGAFRAYIEYHGRYPIPPWESLTAIEKQAWQHAAQEAIDVHIAAAFA